MRSALLRVGLVTSLVVLSMLTVHPAHARVSLSDLQTEIEALQARVQELEAESATHQDQLEFLANLSKIAGRSCPAGLAITGIKENGDLICGAPWAIPSDGEPPVVATNCRENYDSGIAESEMLALLEGVRNELEGSPLPAFSTTADGVDFEVRPDAAQLSGSFLISAELVELTSDEPCADAIKATIVVPDVAVTGEWEAFALGIAVDGEFELVSKGAKVEILARLRSPNLTGAAVGTTLDRAVTSVAVTSFTSDETTTEISGGGGLGAALELLVNQYESFLLDHFVSAVFNSVEPYLANSLPPPVYMEVIEQP